MLTVTRLTLLVMHSLIPIAHQWSKGKKSLPVVVAAMVLVVVKLVSIADELKEEEDDGLGELEELPDPNPEVLALVSLVVRRWGYP